LNLKNYSFSAKGLSEQWSRCDTVVPSTF
jgi:hypothetical protein